MQVIHDSNKLYEVLKMKLNRKERVLMHRWPIAVGLALSTLMMSGCGVGADASQVASSTIIVTKFNGQMNLTATRQSSLVDSSGILQHVDSVSYISETQVIATQDSGNETDVFKSFDEGSSWHQIAIIPGSVSTTDFVDSQAGFALSDNPGNSSASSLFSTSNGGQTWMKVHTAPFISFGFVSAEVGFAVMKGVNSGGTVQSSSLYKTADGGRTWSLVPSPLNASVVSATFSFVSPLEGWVLAGSSHAAGGQVKYLYRTVDAGNTWSQVTQTFSGSGGLPALGQIPSVGYVGQLDFISPTLGFIDLVQGGFFESQDGGKSWTQRRLTGLPVQSERGILRFAAWNSTTFSVVTDRPSFWLTKSQNQWVRVYPAHRETGIYSGIGGLYALSQAGELSAVQTSSSQQVLSRVPSGTIQVDPFPTGIAAYTPATIYITTDGAHWEQVPFPHGWSLAQGRFISEDFGIVVANDNGPPGSAVLELTKNGGSNWETVQTKFHPFAIDPITPTSWWAIGGTDVTLTRNTVKLGSRQMLWNLYFTADGGKSWDEFIANWHAVGGLDFVSTSEGYVWVPGILYRTVDRGSSFVRNYLPPQIGLEGISSMTFEPGGVGWSLGNAGYPIYHTIDAGAHWGPNP
jgi:photosystem II stability/assembly factor-like uncharacterized protein